ncbi:hypothetical protein J3E69DRAFT_323642 [Trichoderma sp. SZMC 28015]
MYLPVPPTSGCTRIPWDNMHALAVTELLVGKQYGDRNGQETTPASECSANRYNDFRRSAATLISCTPPWMGPARTLVGLKEVAVLRNGVVIYRLVLRS